MEAIADQNKIQFKVLYFSFPLDEVTSLVPMFEIAELSWSSIIEILEFFKAFTKLYIKAMQQVIN